jgi:1,4-dihydroxy-2-naphthoate octaprenyltransferase
MAACVALELLPLPALLVFLALPSAWQTVRLLAETNPVRLNLLVRGTAQLHMRFGALLAAGFVIGALA